MFVFHVAKYFTYFTILTEPIMKPMTHHCVKASFLPQIKQLDKYAGKKPRIHIFFYVSSGPIAQIQHLHQNTARLKIVSVTDDKDRLL